MTNSSQPNPDLNSKKTRFSDKWDDLKQRRGFSKFYDYTTHHPKDTIAYILLIFGIILLFFNPFFGSLIIGIVFGLYYASELNFFFNHLNDFIEEQGVVRSIAVGAVLIAILYGVPGLLIGTFFSLVIGKFYNSDFKSK